MGTIQIIDVTGFSSTPYCRISEIAFLFKNVTHIQSSSPAFEVKDRSLPYPHTKGEQKIGMLGVAQPNLSVTMNIKHSVTRAVWTICIKTGQVRIFMHSGDLKTAHLKSGNI